MIIMISCEQYLPKMCWQRTWSVIVAWCCCTPWLWQFNVSFFSVDFLHFQFFFWKWNCSRIDEPILNEMLLNTLSSRLTRIQLKYNGLLSAQS